ncbi:5-formyltetrahydrofolate cyclo-ligase [Alkalispirochaeta americana]|nr:5-formyltetrahydrofolate cyclo-ligase [Alkalispirochaeta americana]
MNKKNLRSSLSRTVRELDPLVRSAAQEQIIGQILELSAWGQSDSVFAYSAMDDEVDLSELLLAARKEGKEVFLPRVGEGKKEMAFFRAFPERENSPCLSLERHRLGFLQPSGKDDSEAIPGNASIVIIPGRAFDLQGRRLGRGGGYYDRWLTRVDPGIALLGVAFGCQVVPEVPCDPWDVAVTRVLRDSLTAFS